MTCRHYPENQEINIKGCFLLQNILLRVRPSRRLTTHLSHSYQKLSPLLPSPPWSLASGSPLSSSPCPSGGASWRFALRPTTRWTWRSCPTLATAGTWPSMAVRTPSLPSPTMTGSTWPGRTGRPWSRGPQGPPPSKCPRRCPGVSGTSGSSMMTPNPGRWGWWWGPWPRGEGRAPPAPRTAVEGASVTKMAPVAVSHNSAERTAQKVRLFCYIFSPEFSLSGSYNMIWF